MGKGRVFLSPWAVGAGISLSSIFLVTRRSTRNLSDEEKDENRARKIGSICGQLLVQLFVLTQRYVGERAPTNGHRLPKLPFLSKLQNPHRIELLTNVAPRGKLGILGVPLLLVAVVLLFASDQLRRDWKEVLMMD